MKSKAARCQPFAFALLQEYGLRFVFPIIGREYSPTFGPEHPTLTAYPRPDENLTDVAERPAAAIAAGRRGACGRRGGGGIGAESWGGGERCRRALRAGPAGGRLHGGVQRRGLRAAGGGGEGRGGGEAAGGCGDGESLKYSQGLEIK